jgi:membrane associated rhomboid family serine protease
MTDLQVVLIPFLSGCVLVVTAKTLLEPRHQLGAKLSDVETSASRQAWALHFGAGLIVLASTVLLGPILLPKSKTIAGAFVGVAAALLASALFRPPKRERTFGLIDRFRFQISIIFHAVIGAALSSFSVAPSA